MKHLPTVQTLKRKLTSLGEKVRSREFPRIFRFIPESFLRPRSTSIYPKLFVISFLSGLVLIAIFVQSILLLRNLRLTKQLEAQRMQLEKEIAYWQQITQKYPDYRDVYFKLASLEYQRGNIQQAQNDIQKAFSVDPNSTQGKVLGDKIKN
jgi:tetratricopeptide (TPR) repeat protein